MRNKNRWTNIILSLIAITLACLCFASVYKPIAFEKKQQKREKAVKAALIKIREAQRSFLLLHGRYSESLDTLVKGQLLKQNDTYIPYSEGMPFELSIDSIKLRNGTVMPLMQCGARYEDYLYGMNEESISRLTNKATNEGRYPGLSIGNTHSPNNNEGNWEK